MNKVKKILNLLEHDYEWGFDLTGITAANWKKVLDSVKIPHKPVLDTDLDIWVWQGPGIKIHTGNDPITGKYSQHGKREDEKDYASFIGVYGDTDKVVKIAKMIHDLADNIKQETPHKSRFI